MNKGGNLDNGIVINDYLNNTDDKQMDREIMNPLINKGEVLINGVSKNLKDFTVRDISQNYKVIYCICLKNGVMYNRNRHNKILSSNVKLCDFIEDAKNYTLLNGSVKMLYNKTHLLSSVLIDRELLSYFNSKGFELNETEIAIPMLNISENDLKHYMNQFEGHFSFVDVIKIITLNDYYMNSLNNEIINNNFTKLLTNMKETDYWTYNYNCKLNLTSKFMLRGFNFSLKHKLKDNKAKKTLKKIQENDKKGDPYLSFLFRKNEYIDMSNTLKKNGYIMYKINDNTNLTNNDVNNMFTKLVNEKDRYNLLNSLLMSKEYCHLVLNNGKLLDMAKDIITKYIPTYKYLFSYAWLIMYIEESIKRTHTKKTDRYIFTLDTVNKLPSFPYNPNEPRTNPYISLLVAPNILNASTNLLGVGGMEEDKYELSNIDKFKKKMNIFLTGKNKNILDGVNWDYVAISGSIMPACIHKKHPLRKLHNKFIDYINEYYSESDVDIMIKTDKSKIGWEYEYIDRVNELYNTLNNNVSNMTMIPNITVALFVNKDYIVNNIVDDKNTLEYIIENLYENDVKKLFYVKYESDKKSKNKYADKYDILNTVSTLDNFNIVIVNNDTSNQTKKKVPDHLSKFIKEVDDNEMLYTHDKDQTNSKYNEMFEVNNKNEIFVWKENFKFKFESPNLLHNFEVFSTNGNDYFETIARFHLPCVRSYYSNDNIYMLPSAVIAYKTYMNIEYKYFSGAKDPIEILNKYRMRGWGTYLNDKEKIHLVEYSSSIDKWNKLYDINKKDKQSVDKIFGSLSLDSNLFKPLNKTYNKPNNNYISDNNKLKDIYRKQFNYDDKHNLLDTNIITNDGYIEPLKKWILNMNYDKLKN